MKQVTWDLETSGLDLEKDRIITCFVRAKDDGETVFEGEWIIDPSIEIPEEASEVHGMTTEWVRENGRKDVREAILEIRDTVEGFTNDGFLNCGFNHSFDLSILDAECKRHTE